MSEVTTALRLLGGVVLLLANGFFVTTEFALTRVRQFPRSEFQTGGLERAWEMTERLEIYLSGCQLGITVSSVGLGVVAEPAVAAVLNPVLQAVGAVPSGVEHAALSVVVALGIINLLHVVVGEQAPTYLGIERTKFVARYGGPLLYWWTKLMSPVIILADRVAKGLLGAFGVEITRSWAEAEAEGDEPDPGSRGELRRTMGETLSNAGLPEERREEVMNALEIGDTTVDEIMVGRDEIVALSSTDDWETNLDTISQSPHTRFPLVDGDHDSFDGVVYAPLLLRRLRNGENPIDVDSVAQPPMEVSPDTVVSDLIDQFQSENQELALVVDGGRTVGLVTATDAFEEITGELQDPLDHQFDLDSDRT
ncbi:MULTISPECIES: hemolysin family protein [Salinibaculum]|uniref:hemolysin family protein n=1 Tax=Salinibaculum TaxID=2732368 RepID=UPI0030D13B4B